MIDHKLIAFDRLIIIIPEILHLKQILFIIVLRLSTLSSVRDTNPCIVKNIFSNLISATCDGNQEILREPGITLINCIDPLDLSLLLDVFAEPRLLSSLHFS